ncbi:Rieske 2Fe-2S domain-containing protein [Streptomyces mirabilis]
MPPTLAVRIVSFNHAEQAWKCPCHGSRYTREGRILQSPAVHPCSHHAH